MKIAIRYYSRSGNTKKLADVISAQTNVPAISVEEGLKEDVDILFLGSSVYAAGIDEAVKIFIQNLDPKQVKMVVNFSTATLLPSTYKQVSKLLTNKGIAIAEKEFHCRGKFLNMHKSRPNEEDIEKCKAFVKEICDE